MSEIGRDGDSVETAHDYFRAVEEIFIERRGAPLLLSPADWRVAEEWYEAGIPLFVVEEALDEVFEARERQEADDRVNSLRYCDPAVRRSWRELVEIRGPFASRSSTDEAREHDLDERIGELAGGLPADLPERDEWAERIRDLGGPADEIERRLGELEWEMVEDLLEGLSEEDRAEVEAEVEAGLARVRDRIPDDELDRLADRFRSRAVRRRFDLEPLTLFR